MSRSLLLIGWLLAGPPVPETPHPEWELEKLQGCWRGSALEVKGETRSWYEARTLQFAFVKNTFTVKQGDRVIAQGYFRIDLSKRPRAIDLAITETVQEENKGRVVQGIYEVNGLDLKLCTTRSAGGERPKKLSTSRYSNTTETLFTLKKELP
jgi:uncharacterized protein (TIGR03067 family)